MITGQDYLDMSYLDVTNGLSNNYASTIISDQLGLKWIATEGGINRFDGDQVRHFGPGVQYPGLFNENIETLYEDSQGYLWVGTKSGGVSRYNPRKDKFRNYNTLLGSDSEKENYRIVAFTEGKDGLIWMSAWGKGLYAINPQTDSLERFYEFGNQTLRDIICDSFGNIWAIGYNVLVKYDPSEDRIISIPGEFGTGFVLKDQSDKGHILIGSSVGLFRFTTDNYQFEELDLGLSYKGVNAINVDDEGQLWLGSWQQGLIVGDTSFRQFRTVPLDPFYGQADMYRLILDIHIDDHGIIWVGTGYGGVVKITRERYADYITPRRNEGPSLPDYNIQSLQKDRNGQLWLGTWSSGLAVIDEEAQELLYRESTNAKVSVMLPVGTDMIVGTSNGLYAYPTDRMADYRSLAPSIRKVTTLYKDPADRLWIGTQQQGLMRGSLKNGRLSNIQRFYVPGSDQSQLDANRISVIRPGMKEDLWVGTYNGLYRYSGADSSFLRWDERLGLPSVIVLSLKVDPPNERLLVGMSGGFAIIDLSGSEPRLEQIVNRDNGLQNEYITSITSGPDGQIWGANSTSVFQFDQSTNTLTDYGIDRIAPMNIGSVLAFRDQLYFGGAKGVVRLHPRKMNAIPIPPEVIFTSLNVDNQEVRVGEEVNGRTLLQQHIQYADRITLSHAEKVFSLAYVSNDFLDSENLSYLYRIIGLQEKWVNNKGNNKISLTGLKAGDYEIQIKASRNGTDYGPVKKLQLQVLPPFWASDIAKGVYAFILVLIGLLIRRVVRWRSRLKLDVERIRLAREKDQDLTEAKLKFFTNISHELRTPLTMITSPLSELVTDPSLQPRIRQRIDYVNKNANRLLHLINQLLDFRKADKGLLRLQAAHGDFVRFVHEIYLSFVLKAEEEGVDFRFEKVTDTLPLTFDRDKMEIVLCNLLSNAFKFTEPGGTITLRISEKDGQGFVTVSDTGKGIPSEHQDKVFDRFYQIKDAETLQVGGSGIGLSLAKDIVQLHGGTIDLDSAPGRGTDITFSIPKGEAHLMEDQKLDTFRNSDDFGTYLEEATEKSSSQEPELIVLQPKDQHSVLVVDDNKDIRDYLSDMLEDQYHVYTAANGEEAYELALEVIPDLIISDVMMPKMDGIALCKLLKEELKTSHIPIILLTARTSTVFEVDGLQTGADDYIKKPFDTKVLLSRVKTTLENREKVRSYFYNKLRFETPTKVAGKNFEEKFIDKAMQLVLDNLSNEQFGVEYMASELCMSHPTLYRKIKSLTGMSIAGFIRSIRLKKASEILVTQDLNLSSVGYEVGFNDYKYFKKSFKSQFGMSPGAYREKALSEHKR
jgi:signal transduction histidine kinase/ligand-binding sensor domain-containing protein/DNA-binding response OmpR family regulator